ncbi:hypothetical protein [uncultured Methanobrevibacter sp.]|uniref:hypothetical protein n=1 Tax=uncultured Methanobrevibacter sp. TaxID=253161 RepID=UPI0025E425C8|nr:hypothetical protein [uncultured Methanobrevibacter sp.]
MTEDKRFIDNGIEDIENQSFTDNLTGKTYWIDNGLDEIVNLLNTFNDESEQLKSYNGEMEDYLARLEEENERLRKENKELHFIIQQNNFAKQEGFE